MSYRLAIAISGAVSLGSYEAGVLYEIIRAIGAHNERVTDPEERIEIDVLTGASAGGMTAAIVAQKLLLDQDALQEPLDNALYNPWVRDIDIRELLVEHPEDNPSNAIFSGAVIARLAEQHFLAPLDGRTLSGRHPAAGPQVHLGLALSNLVGIDYQIPTFQHSDLLRPADGFAYRRFEDKLLATITPATTDRAFWSQIAAAARACGAFPFAFPAVEVPRRLDEPAYTLSGSRLVDWSPHSGRFTYTDGGVFNNYPLGMAKQLANLVDTEPNDYTRRFYLYVSPWGRGRQEVSTFTAEEASIPQTAKALLGAIYQQAGFQDWIATDRYNELVACFDERAYALRDAVAHMPPAERGHLHTLSAGFLDALYPENDDQRTRDYARLRAQFMVGTEAEALLADHGEPAVEAWIRAVQVLERAAGLGNKDILTVYTITAGDEELASEGMHAFAGFFDRAFRDYDYNAGRRKARQFIEALLALRADPAKAAGHLPLQPGEAPPPLPAQDESLRHAQMRDIDPGARRHLAERFGDRAERTLRQLGVNWVLRRILMSFVLKKRIRAFLDL